MSDASFTEGGLSVFDEAIKGMNEETNNGIVAVGREKKTYTVEEIQNILEISRASAFSSIYGNRTICTHPRC